jgi:putative secretion ATPase (PEP-CTERM system associated)
VYEKFFGLTAKPFQLNPDPAFFFGSRGPATPPAYLQYGVHQSEGFIIITGEVGAGKTTLVRSLLEQIDPNQLVAARLVTTQLDADDLLRAVAIAFGLATKAMDKAQLLAELEAFLVSLVPQGKRALLIVDEAQNLSRRAIEELRMLSNFQLGNQGLLQSFLVGQPELRQLMQGPELQQRRQRVTASYHLGPIDRAETQAYVEHRRKHVGWGHFPRLRRVPSMRFTLFQPAFRDVSIHSATACCCCDARRRTRYFRSQRRRDCRRNSLELSEGDGHSAQVVGRRLRAG